MTAQKSPRERELRGRGNGRLELPMHDDSSDGPKLCECGCGHPAPIATKTYSKWGHVAGEPMRFLRGHNRANVSMSDVMKQRLSERWSGRGNPRYSNGRHSDSRGYVVLVLPEEHPFASMRDARSRVYLHRLVMAEHLGRALAQDEEIHHLDEDKSNNELTNLLLVSGFEHRRIHALIMHDTDALTAVGRVIAERTQ
jgi:hypothetical protein